MKTEIQVPARREAMAREMTGILATSRDNAIIGKRLDAGAATVTTPADLALLSEWTSAPITLKLSCPRTVLSGDPKTPARS